MPDREEPLSEDELDYLVACDQWSSSKRPTMFHRAAREIRSLRAEVERLRGEVEEIRTAVEWIADDVRGARCPACLGFKPGGWKLPLGKVPNTPFVHGHEKDCPLETLLRNRPHPQPEETK